MAQKFTHIYPPEILTMNQRRYYESIVKGSEWEHRYAYACGLLFSIGVNEENRSLRKAQMMGVEYAIRLSEATWNEERAKLIREAKLKNG